MKRLLQNSLLLILCQIGGMFIPLIELPILTRNLAPDAYGQVIFIISITLITSSLIEFGFTFSASRKIAENPSKENKSTICTDVFFAKIILSIISLFLLYVILQIFKQDQMPNSSFIFIILLTISMGFSPIWYFIGTERLVIPAILDISIRVCGLISLLILLPLYPSPETALMIISIIGIINTLIPSIIMLCGINLQPISLKRAIALLKESFNLFIFKSIHTIQQSIVSILLVFFGGFSLVGIFTPAEKLNRAIIGLMTPIMNVFFPFFIKSKDSDLQRYKKIFIVFSLTTVLILLAISLLVIIFAPLIINLVFGPSYQQSIIILQLLAILLPLKGLNMTLNIIWFIPLKKEMLVNKVLALNLLLLPIMAYFLITPYGAVGFSIGLISMELIISLILILFSFNLWRKI